jgi:hypothetical protein
MDSPRIALAEVLNTAPLAVPIDCGGKGGDSYDKG